MITTSTAPAPQREEPTPALPQPTKDRGQDWAAKAELAMEARRQGAKLRRGKRKSFRPVVGRI
ncbi:Hypothetical protein ACGLYG10_3016 [Actinomyces glycerinitolerans]|uniref:Uncharacterized protein n=2 Tax=Actinomycetaceae TaxID=2049 RepID=A0A1M4S3F8_9ACTO|nr:Hypothetical protein ACGLYG10_3016 [Actinomyces glycerinitolerans]